MLLQGTAFKKALAGHTSSDLQLVSCPRRTLSLNALQALEKKERDKALFISPYFWNRQVWVNVSGQLKPEGKTHLSHHSHHQLWCTFLKLVYLFHREHKRLFREKQTLALFFMKIPDEPSQMLSTPDKTHAKKNNNYANQNKNYTNQIHQLHQPKTPSTPYKAPNKISNIPTKTPNKTLSTLINTNYAN